MAELMDATQRDLHAQDAVVAGEPRRGRRPHRRAARLMGEPGDFVVEVDELDDVVGDLEACERDLSLLVADLERQMVALHGTWEGLAATAQREAHQEWSQGMAAMHAALDRPAGRRSAGARPLRRGRDHQRRHVAAGPA